MPDHKLERRSFDSKQYFNKRGKFSRELALRDFRDFRGMAIWDNYRALRKLAAQELGLRPEEVEALL